MSPVCCPNLLSFSTFECTPWLLVCLQHVLGADLLQRTELARTMHVMTADAWSQLFGGQMQTLCSCAYKNPMLILQDIKICYWLDAEFVGNLTCNALSMVGIEPL